ncbi:tRNA (guanosine(37)-N1)-methyltransferase TrmD [Caldimonas brevitalea]|uniref:tRNA (guanine-N(1)-)-methyltransferase n=1 Tax=Caldimonas brevitalea TaxID=413882 RepID=A0A0G3BLX8_9BURK|nr:tRNA (guanosine(37)-N1)-methyltransferase TrmD [Caldimonas brevitalea]AKJ30444.1 tRNA (guanine-N1)-methyltransferase [Caldimonas brevitalea]
MRFDVLTLFPELFQPFLTQGVTRRAYESGQVDVHFWQLRDYAEDNYRRVDDRPYGGGPGMVMLVEPLERALAAAVEARRAAEAPVAPVILFTPTGRRIDQPLLREWAQGPGAIFVCGRYEGVDQRFVDRHVDLELSLGDFVLSGGELPALAVLDGVARLQPGVLNDAQSHQQDSFSAGLLDCPHYSRPEVLAAEDGAVPVPPVLLSGHHAAIARWRREQSLRLTAERRPELIAQARARGELTQADERYLAAFGL